MQIRTRTGLLAAGLVVLATVAEGPTPLGAVAGRGGVPVAAAQAARVAELPPLGGNAATPYDIDGYGRVVGVSSTAAGDDHPVLWRGGRPMDLAPSLPPGAVGVAEGIGDDGRVVGYLSQALPGGGGPGVVTWFRGGVTTLSSPPATGDEAVDINNRSQVLYRDGGRSFLWSNGVTTPAPEVAPGVPLQLADINEWGLTVGTSAPPDPENRRAYAWFPGLPPVPLGTLGGSWSEAVAVNDLGQVVGRSESAGGAARAFVTQGTTLVDLGDLGGGESGFLERPGIAPRLVSNLGHVVGWSRIPGGQQHAFLWRDGRMTDLGGFGPGNSLATALNDLGQVVGGSAGGEAVFVDAAAWHGGRVVDLGRLTGVPRIASVAVDVNNRGQVIGPSTPPAGGNRAWLWTLPTVAGHEGAAP